MKKSCNVEIENEDQMSPNISSLSEKSIKKSSTLHNIGKINSKTSQDSSSDFSSDDWELDSYERQ